jgi:intraflagellar transport protein 81
LNEIVEEYSKLQIKWTEKQEQGSKSKKILVGDDFKRYVSELRGKSTLFKRKKAEMSSITTEYGIIQRTQEVFCMIF